MRHFLALSERPDLAPLVASWRVGAFFRDPGGPSVETYIGWLLDPPVGPEDNFVLFEADQPVGTAGLVRADLKSRPDLTPWLAGLFVLPAFRGRGHGAALVRHVEAFAHAARVPTIWLYTATAQSLYARLGWQSAAIEQEHGRPVLLMRRDLDAPL